MLLEMAKKSAIVRGTVPQGAPLRNNQNDPEGFLIMFFLSSPADRAKLYLWTWLALVGLFGVILWGLAEVLLPFVVGLAVAYLLDPLCRALVKLRLPRALAALVVLGLFVAFIGLVLVKVVPLLVDQGTALAAQAPDALLAVREKIQPYLDQIMRTLSPDDKAQLKATIEQYSGNAMQILGVLVRKVWTNSAAVFGAVSFLFITPVVAFYMMKDWPKILSTVDDLLPRPYAPAIRARLSEIDRTLAGFLRGQTTVCLILALYYAIALTLSGLNYGLIIGVTAGLLTFIPYVGAGLGLITSLAIAIFQFPDMWHWGVILGIFVFAQLVEGNYITPKLVGESVGLHPVWIIFALMAGGALFGFTGLFLGVPVAAIIGVLIRSGLGLYRQSALYFGTQGPVRRRAIGPL